jgi:hypothetical protein
MLKGPLCSGPERFANIEYLLAPSVLLGDENPISLQSSIIISVLLPESFRGGCSFGAAIKAISPENNFTFTIYTVYLDSLHFKILFFLQ